MKNIFIFFTLCLAIIMFFSPSELLAADVIKVEVTEKVPGATCSGPDSKWVYTCDVGTGFSSVTIMIGKLIRYFTYIAALTWVLFIVINGILYSMSGIDAGLKDSAKKRIVQTLLGLILLLLSGTILYAIAPWIYTA